MTLTYRIVDEGYHRELITQEGDGSYTHMDYFIVEFVIEAPGFEHRRFAASYARHRDGTTTRVGFTEEGAPRGGSYHMHASFPDDIEIDFAALERYSRERGEKAFAQEPPFNERERLRKGARI